MQNYARALEDRSLSPEARAWAITNYDKALREQSRRRLRVLPTSKAVHHAEGDPSTRLPVTTCVPAMRITKATALCDAYLHGTHFLATIRVPTPTVDVIRNFLTARETDEDRVRGLRLGADDYIVKPFSSSELLARIETVLRRSSFAGQVEGEAPVTLGDLTIDFAGRQVTVEGKPIFLTPTEYKLLCQLGINAGRVLTHDQILQQVWGPEYSGEPELVRSMVRNLRRKLGEDARHPRYILSEPGVGYRMPRP